MGFTNFFDRFKKKKDEPQIPADLTIWDLQTGYMLDYEGQTWEIQACFEYDWGNNSFSREYKIHNGDETAFLHLEEDDHLSLTLSRKIKLTDLGQEMIDTTVDTDEPPKRLSYKGKSYLRKNTSMGAFRDLAEKEEVWYEFVSWNFVDTEGNEFITFERWGETDFDASIGIYVEEYEIKNFLPR